MTYNYTRTYEIHASHFNGQAQYDYIWGYLDQDIKQEHVNVPLADIINNVILQSHGHNFVVVVDVQADELPESGWMVEDVELMMMVHEWHRTNISLHKDFLPHRVRATTERMAKVLCDKVDNAWPGNIVTVRVFETSRIFAEYTNAA